MSGIDWNRVFPVQLCRNTGLSETDLSRFVATVLQPFTSEELRTVAEERWILPSGPLPESYLSLLRWSNGGEFRNGDRLMQFFPALDPQDGVRCMMLLYGVPEFTPGILPFAFNGGGVFYAFDMRHRAVNGEYRIVAADTGTSHTPFPLGNSLLEVCEGTDRIEDLWDEQDEVFRPRCPTCNEYLICPECGERGPIEHR